MKYCLIFVFINVSGNFLFADADFYQNYLIRKVTMQDNEQLFLLYKKVAAIPGGLTRTVYEITQEYINTIISNAIDKGLGLVVEFDGKLIGSMIKYKIDLQAYRHILTGGSILIDPDYQGRGIGTHLILRFLEIISLHYSDILRVEISANILNPAIKLYERLGFQYEGRFDHAIKNMDETLISGVSMVWMNPNYNFYD